MPQELIVRDGAILAYRLYGIAHEIDLARVESLWASQPGAARRGWRTATPPKAMAFGVPPVALPLGPVSLEVEGTTVTADVTARIYDFGVISFALRFAAANLDWPAYAARYAALDHALGLPAGKPIWSGLLQQMRALLGPALIRPAPRRFSTIARRLYTLVAEVTEFTEKLDNALQVTGDVYLARVYAGALDLFRVHAISAAVDRKLAILRDTYTALHDEAASARGEMLEILVVVLIAMELVLPFIHK